jgi:hypothetical protein
MKLIILILFLSVAAHAELTNNVKAVVITSYETNAPWVTNYDPKGPPPLPRSPRDITPPSENRYVTTVVIKDLTIRFKDDGKEVETTVRKEHSRITKKMEWKEVQ